MTQATQKSLDYFIIRFLSFYQINATKVEKIVYYTRFIRRTVTLVTRHSSLRSSCPNQLVLGNQTSYKTRIIIYLLLRYKCKKLSFIARTGLKYERGMSGYFKGYECNKGTFYTYVLQHFIYDYSVNLLNGNFDNDFQCKKWLIFTRS
jgi:hypothetical protein